jgi:hypothetical protein
VDQSTPLIVPGIYELLRGLKLLYMLLLGQIRAICIMLDAEVATRERIRAPHPPNAPRRDRLPLLSYHVIRLAKRYRSEPHPGDQTDEPVSHRRLHFRRGHWRHYENHRTWIRWQLVGDESLGIVLKDYIA